VVDGTDRLAQPGLVEFLGPSDLTLASHFGVSGYWVRALFELGDDAVEPRLRALLPNTTFAAQTVTVHNELLGSSDASKSQQFRTTRSPVLASQQLEVLETGPLSAEDLAALEAAYGAGGVTPADNGSANAVWVRWIEVPDLYGSGPQDRHYILDHITGDVRFGDGTQGRIPPRGAGNVRMALYQTGGGDAGDRAAGTIVQMKTTVPYIDQVFNVEAAAGGFGAESLDALVTRAPRTLRHGGRAVAAEDYEDLARLASPEVARARCVPLRLLQNDPLGSTPLAGAVSVIVVPGSADPKPLPSVELLAGVEEFLRARKAVIAEIAAVGPLYVRVDVVAEVVLTSLEGASQVEQTILTQLAAFLHPLTGGRDGAGWDFGRQPHLSDLYAVVSSVPQVDHIRQLSMTQLEDLAGAIATGRFLVYSGQHQITLTFGVQ
jgi:predicted phage baseplate assembly protein